eukprot:TRINITY_DN43404_c0_g1_i1.p1 TRINITY_DN43404_c0_g1~~TRINITY_DN43404_c0_g1_i1.p1  ORF type:complete len:198 (+),score=33.32 TRINITY_DN43404_c0_g1_i1:63-596(+)
MAFDLVQQGGKNWCGMACTMMVLNQWTANDATGKVKEFMEQKNLTTQEGIFKYKNDQTAPCPDDRLASSEIATILKTVLKKSGVEILAERVQEIQGKTSQEDIKKYLENNLLIITVKPINQGPHFIILYGSIPGNEFQIADPATGAVCTRACDVICTWMDNAVDGGSVPVGVIVPTF